MSKPKAEKRQERPDGRRADQAINAYAQYRVEQWLQEHPDKTATDLAETLEISDPTVSILRSRAEGVGWHFARRLSQLFGMSLAEFVAEADRFWAERERGEGVQQLRDHPDWKRITTQLLGERKVTADELRRIESHRAQLSAPVTPAFILGMIEFSRANETPKPARKPRRN